MSLDPSVVSRDYAKQCADWDMIAALWGSTRAMIEAGETLLPRFRGKNGQGGESEEVYRSRLNHAVLFNATRRTCERLAGKPFEKEIGIEDDVPARVKPLLENVDNEGTALGPFARSFFNLGVRDGRRAILVDMPPSKIPAGAPLGVDGVEDEKRRRPSWVEIDTRNIIGWKAEIRNGKRVLTQVRIRDNICKTDPDNEFAEVQVQRVRVIDAATTGGDVLAGVGAQVLTREFTVYRIFELVTDEKKQTEWRVVEAGQMKPQTEIPLAFFLPRKTSIATGDLPLIDLAWLNVAHWRSESDQRNILHKARVPIGVLTGFNKDEIEKGLMVEVSTDRWIVSDQPQARAGYMEHSGAAIQAGERDLEALENRMRVMGLEFLVLKQVTATEGILDEKSNTSELHAWVDALKDCLENALRFTAIWLGVAVKDAQSGETHGGQLDIFKDFGISSRDFQELTFLLEARKAREISQETFLGEFARRVAGDDFSVKEEMRRLDEERANDPVFDPNAMNPPNANPPPNANANPAQRQAA